MPLETRALLFDIKHAGNGIELFVQDRTLDQFKSDLMLRLAVERQFEIIGEALNRLRRVDPASAQKISEHERIIGFRNVLSHGYDAVNSEVTWRIIKEKLPILQREVDALLG